MIYKAGIQVIVYGHILIMVAGVPTTKLQIRRGESASLTCVFQQLDVKTLIRWKSAKEGILTIGTTIYKQMNNIEVQKPTQNDWTLIIKRLDNALAGDYTCETDSGTVIAQYTVEIVDAPRIIPERSSVRREKFSEGSTHELKCYFSGNPTPTVRWYRGLENTVDTGITGEILRFPNMTRYAYDTYICEGRNSFGGLNYTIDIEVNFPVEVDVMEEVIHIKGGSVVSLVCVVEGHPIKDAYWMDPEDKKITPGWKFNVTAEQDGDFPVLFLTATSKGGTLVTDEDFGNYNCVGKGASNSAKKATRLVRVASANDLNNN